MKAKAVIINRIAAVFIFLFAYTAIDKLISFASFRNNISQSPFIGQYSSMIAVMLPILELVAVVLLFLPKTRLAGLYASLGLMSVFSLYIGYALLLKLKLPCSCGGILQDLNWQQHFWVNIVLTLLSAVAIHFQTKTSQQKLKILLQ
ncbi:MAG TPA: MauE/DoxX family redox-associated membrane protein [Flavisolibacter sp.]|nr:MauE/DoxX family redox-associated membrane protein [Flavisolibacter sp.]